jgi:hypothetical protein
VSRCVTSLSGGYAEEQIREELGSEPENPESSEGSVGHAALD